MKPIKYTPELIEQYAQAAYDKAKKEMQENVACHNKALKLEIPDGVIAPHVIISDEALAKSKALVEQCQWEIAWHGIVNADREKGIYYIKDVIVPPQHVTGASVDCDSNEWALWAAQFDNETFNSIRCHMHSHVNMGVFSSGIDDDYQKDVVTKDSNLDYYIFLIWNKKGDLFARFYDVENNVMFDNKEFVVSYESNGINEWAAKEIEEKVTSRPAYSWKGGNGTYIKNANLPGQMNFSSKNGILTADYDDDEIDSYIAAYGVPPTAADKNSSLEEVQFGQLKAGEMFFDEDTDNEYTKLDKGAALDSSGRIKVRFNWNKKVFKIVK